MNARADWVSTDAVAKAAGVVPATLTRWAERGLLPRPTKIFRGRKGNRRPHLADRSDGGQYLGPDHASPGTPGLYDHGAA